MIVLCQFPSFMVTNKHKKLMIYNNSSHSSTSEQRREASAADKSWRFLRDLLLVYRYLSIVQFDPCLHYTKAGVFSAANCLPTDYVPYIYRYAACLYRLYRSLHRPWPTQLDYIAVGYWLTIGQVKIDRKCRTTRTSIGDEMSYVELSDRHTARGQLYILTSFMADIQLNTDHKPGCYRRHSSVNECSYQQQAPSISGIISSNLHNTIRHAWVMTSLMQHTCRGDVDYTHFFAGAENGIPTIEKTAQTIQVFKRAIFEENQQVPPSS